MLETDSICTSEPASLLEVANKFAVEYLGRWPHNNQSINQYDRQQIARSTTNNKQRQDPITWPQ